VLSVKRLKKWIVRAGLAVALVALTLPGIVSICAIWTRRR
jgi:hypothetical protein